MAVRGNLAYVTSTGGIFSNRHSSRWSILSNVESPPHHRRLICRPLSRSPSSATTRTSPRAAGISSSTSAIRLSPFASEESRAIDRFRPAVAAAGNTVYCSMANAWPIYNVTNPAAPVLLSTITFGGTVTDDIVVSGGYA